MQQRLPGMPVGIDETGAHDHRRRIDHLRIGDLEFRGHRGDQIAFDQQIAGAEVFGFAVHRQDRGALEEDAWLVHARSVVRSEDYLAGPSLAFCTTSFHFAMSLATMAPNAAGVPPTGM